MSTESLAESLAAALAGDRGFALLTPISTHNLFLHCVDDQMELLALIRKLSFDLAEPIDGFCQFVFGEIG